MLYQDFLTTQGKNIIKPIHYFPIYEKHLDRFRDKSIVFWEIGVQYGGSLQMWQKYLGPFAKIIGIDIDPKCKIHGNYQVDVCIGDQADTDFLQSVIEKHGSPDVVIDDGSHKMEDICTSFNFLYDKVQNNGIYLVEDLHTAYWESHGGGLHKEGTFIERCKPLIDSLNARHNGMDRKFADSTFSMHFYDSVVVFEKQIWHNDFIQISTPYNRGKYGFPEYEELEGFEKIIFYGCGGYLQLFLLSGHLLPYMPHEIWDIDAVNIRNKKDLFLVYKNLTICKPKFNIKDKSKIAIIVTLEEGKFRDNIKAMLRDKGFTSVF